MTATTPRAATPAGHRSAAAPLRGTSAPIVVAAKSAGGDDATLAAAHLAAWQLGAPVEVITVVEPPPPVVAAGVAVPAPMELMEAERAAARAGVHERLRTSAGAATDWPVHVVVGSPGHTIAAEAAARQARLLVVGIGRHAVADRLFGRETALQTIRSAARPVLAVAPAHRGAPFSRAVAAIDFSPASVAAARAALALLADDAVLWLVHAVSAHELADEPTGWGEGAGERRAADLFDRVRAALDVPGGVRVETVRLAGRAPDVVLRFAAENGADLVSAGRHGYARVERVLAGSVTNALIRRAACSVLVGAEPRAEELAEIERRMQTPAAVPREAWPDLFARFSQRNRGRRARQSGAPAATPLERLGRETRFVEAVYEPAMERLDVVFEDDAQSRRLHGVVRVSVPAATLGRDAALDVDHSGGWWRLSVTGPGPAGAGR